MAGPHSVGYAETAVRPSSKPHPGQPGPAETGIRDQQRTISWNTSKASQVSEMGVLLNVHYLPPSFLRNGIQGPNKAIFL